MSEAFDAADVLRLEQVDPTESRHAQEQGITVAGVPGRWGSRRLPLRLHV
jgi:hypothetical protein